jgi:cobalt transporter subunit CbtB
MAEQGVSAMPSNLSTTAGAVSGQRATVVLPALLAAFLGTFLIFGVGFSHISAFHNAAHDTRHSNAFPCH